MTGPSATAGPVARPSPRRRRSTDPSADRTAAGDAVVDQTRLEIGSRTVRQAARVLEGGERRLVRIVAVYAAAAVAWLGLLALLTPVVGDLTNWSSVTGMIVAGVAFVLGSSGIMLLALRRWARQLANAAAAEQRAMEELREVARIRAAFLGGISHELRTPMTSILGFAQTIQRHHRELDADNLEEFAGRLVANTTRLERLVLDMLDLHRSEPEGDDAREPVHVEQLLRAAVATTGPREQHITVWSPAKWVVTDRRRLERIATELVSNVVRHTPSGTRAWLRGTVDVAAGVLIITMEDDGPGLDAQPADAMTAPFVQGPRAQADPSPGLGTGLALCRRYAEVLGGTLTLSRPSTGGTCVTVTLPYEPATIAERTA